jgi:hypothetical protein
VIIVWSGKAQFGLASHAKAQRSLGAVEARCPWSLLMSKPFSAWRLPFGTTTLEAAIAGRSVEIGSSLAGWLWP